MLISCLICVKVKCSCPLILTPRAISALTNCLPCQVHCGHSKCILIFILQESLQGIYGYLYLIIEKTNSKGVIILVFYCCVMNYSKLSDCVLSWRLLGENHFQAHSGC